MNGWVDVGAVLAAFDEQMRRTPAEGFERVGPVVRAVGEWCGVEWADVDEDSADRVIAEQVRYFAGLGRDFEWKYYGYDRPADLPERLRRAGLVAGQQEALMVAEVGDVGESGPPVGVELVPVTDAEGVGRLVELHGVVFGQDNAEFGQLLAGRPAKEPEEMVMVLAMAGEVAVCGARIEFHAGTEFASLWGGGTRKEWRGRGIYRAMVSYRAGLARQRGFRYLRVDAMPASRPILARSGFAQLTTTVPYVFSPVPAPTP